MTQALRNLRTTRVAILAAITIVGGLALDLFFVGPGSKKLAQFERKRVELIGQVSKVQYTDLENQRLQEYLDKRNLRSEDISVEDPTVFLGNLIEESKLVRLELKAIDSIESANLTQSRFFIRVIGNFDYTLGFVKSLESGPRLVSIDEIKVSSGSDRKKLETRINLSIFDPLGSL
jgi:hypothetical protein